MKKKNLLFSLLFSISLFFPTIAVFGKSVAEVVIILDDGGEAVSGKQCMVDRLFRAVNLRIQPIIVSATVFENFLRLQDNGKKLQSEIAISTLIEALKYREKLRETQKEAQRQSEKMVDYIRNIEKPIAIKNQDKDLVMGIFEADKGIHNGVFDQFLLSDKNGEKKSYLDSLKENYGIENYFEGQNILEAYYANEAWKVKETLKINEETLIYEKEILDLQKKHIKALELRKNYAIEALKIEKMISEYFEQRETYYCPDYLRAFNLFNPSEWDLHMHDKGGFYLLIPKEYAHADGFVIDNKSISQSVSVSTFDQCLEYVVKHGKQKQGFKSFSCDHNKINLAALLSMFAQQDEELVKSWIVCMNGHGFYARIKRGKEWYHETGSARICGLSCRKFCQILSFFDKKKGGTFFHYVSCFAGGYNRKRVQDFLQKEKISYPIVSASLTGSVVSMPKVSIRTVKWNEKDGFIFDAGIDEYKKALKAIKEKNDYTAILDVLNEGVSDLPWMYTPEQGRFVIADPRHGRTIVLDEQNTSQTEELIIMKNKNDFNGRKILIIDTDTIKRPLIFKGFDNCLPHIVSTRVDCAKHTFARIKLHDEKSLQDFLLDSIVGIRLITPVQLTIDSLICSGVSEGNGEKVELKKVKISNGFELRTGVDCGRHLDFNTAIIKWDIEYELNGEKHHATVNDFYKDVKDESSRITEFQITSL